MTQIIHYGATDMFNQAQELQSLQQAQLEKALRLSSIVLSSAERFANLQLELSKKLIAEQADVVKTLAEVKDVKSLADAQAQFSQPSVDQVFGMARSVYDVAVQTQNEVQAFMEEQMLDFNKQLCANLDKLSKNAPAGSDTAVNAMKNMLTSATAAYDSVTKTAKKVSAELAEAGAEAAANSAKVASAAVNRSAAKKA
ncbi:phasin family protein [Laribacter hongkongensis]|nr:phasin family protein [Laribacter hongkongensis]MCG9041550.1 phasin family protein [Laribacter hongkongensis]MCG9055778.1 phasin family protein [Laribacter hongkongensis]MCG9067838.1 phasin family protein [Laribacter hongkongensis]